MILLPILTIILLSILTRKIIPSLFFGIWLGSTLLNNYNPIVGFLKIFDNHIIPSLSQEWNVTVILYGGAFGGFLSLLQKTDAFFAFAKFFTKKVKNEISAQLAAMAIGLFAFFDDYFSCLVTGSVMRPITDKLQIAREKLAYIVDTTAAPICLLVPFSTWVIYIVGLIGQENNYKSLSYITYLKTIPYNIYPIIALFCLFFFILKKKQIGPMKSKNILPIKTQDDIEISNTKKIFYEKNKNIELKSLFIPLGIFFISFISVFLYSADVWKENSFNFASILQKSKAAYSFLISSVIAAMSTLFLGVFKKKFNFSIGFNYYIDGIKSMVRTYLILLLAWSMSSVTKQLQVADFLSTILQNNIPISFLPLILFLVSSIISFATGTSYGTFAMLIPLALTIASKLNLEVHYILAPILSGGIFGDHSSFFSDTTILTCRATKCDIMSHFFTQLPYCLLTALSAMTGFLFFGLFSNYLLAICASFFSFFIFVTVIEKTTKILKQESFLHE